MSKHPHHHAYPAGSTDLATASLLTVWSSLGDYQNDIVLVGGLVPKFLCNNPPDALPAVTTAFAWTSPRHSCAAR